MYNKEYFIAKFEAIPEHLWGKYALGSSEVKCVFGHCGVIMGCSGHGYVATDEALALIQLFGGVITPRISWSTVTSINDCWGSPKEAILKHLKSL